MLVAADIIKHQFMTGMWKAYRDGIAVESDTLKINPHSIDVTLGPTIKRVVVAPGCDWIDIHKPESFRCIEVTLGNGGYVMQPDDFILGCARERFETSNPIVSRPKSYDVIEMITGAGDKTYATQLYDGRSTTGRIGIQSHMTAGYGDYGFAGCFTLEIAVKLPVLLRPFMRIGQVSFVPLMTWASPPAAYNGVYTQIEPTPADPVLGPDRF